MSPTFHEMVEFLQNWRNTNPELYDRNELDELDEEFAESVEAEATIYLQMLKTLLLTEYSREIDTMGQWNAVNRDGSEQAIREGELIMGQTRDWGPNHFWIMAASTDKDNRGNFQVWLAQGGKRWDRGEWFYLGNTADDLRIESGGLFPVWDEDEAEEALKKSDYWESEGVLAFWMQFAFDEEKVEKQINCLNWIEWPERFVPLDVA